MRTLEEIKSTAAPMWQEHVDHRGDTWQAIASFRWAVSSMGGARALQQLWVCQANSKQEWRPIPEEFV